LTDKDHYFDTIAIDCAASGFSSADFVQAQFHKYGINIRKVDQNTVSVSFDEITSLYDLDEVIEIFRNLKTNKIGEPHHAFDKYKGKKYIPMP
jgi:glycine dehydrogenase